MTSILGNHTLERHRVFEQQVALGKRLQIATELIRRKLRNSIQALKLGLPPSRSRTTAIQRITQDLDFLEASEPKSIRALLGIEGRSAYVYFNAWQGLPLKWKDTARHPIPSDWYWAGPRQSRIGNKTGSRNRRASHPVNAMLNYAYAVLESQVRIRVICEGYDPQTGFLHSESPKRDAFVLDLMEPMRPIVDRAVLNFIEANSFHPADFILRTDGVCRLHQQLAANIVATIGLALQNLITNQRAFGLLTQLTVR